MGQGLTDAEHEICVTPLDHGERLGMSFIVTASLISLVTVSALLGAFTVNLYRNIKSSRNGDWVLVKTDIDAYFLSLLVGDLLQALGGSMNIGWIVRHRSHCGHFCTFQGISLQLGTPVTALSTLAIAIHTFFVIFFKWIPPRSNYLRTTVIILIWLFMFFAVLVGWAAHRTSGYHFYTPTPFWCWVSPRYTNERIVGEYVWIWLTTLVSLIIYALLFLRLRGNIIVNPDRWLHFTFRFSPALYAGPGESQIGRRGEASSVAQKEARKMLWYPLCYIIVILPQSVVRWQAFVGGSVPPFTATAATAFIFKLSGVVNVILFMLTRPSLLFNRYSPPPAVLDPPTIYIAPEYPEGRMGPRVRFSGMPDSDEGNGDGDFFPVTPAIPTSATSMFNNQVIPHGQKQDSHKPLELCIATPVTPSFSWEATSPSPQPVANASWPPPVQDRWPPPSNVQCPPNASVHGTVWIGGMQPREWRNVSVLGGRRRDRTFGSDVAAALREVRMSAIVVPDAEKDLQCLKQAEPSSTGQLQQVST